MLHVFVFFTVRFLCIGFFFVYTFLAVVLFIPAYQIWWRVEFPRLLCGRSYATATVFGCLLILYLPLNPLFCWVYGGFRLLDFNFILFLFYFFVFAFTEGNTSTILHCFTSHCYSSMRSRGGLPSTVHPTDSHVPNISLTVPLRFFAVDLGLIDRAMKTISSNDRFSLCLIFFCLFRSLGGSFKALIIIDAAEGTRGGGHVPRLARSVARKKNR